MLLVGYGTILYLLCYIANCPLIPVQCIASSFADLLMSTIKSHPYVILESMSRLREAFDYLPLLPLTTADGFLRSVQPLLRLSPSLRDALVIVLRKAVFSRFCFAPAAFCTNVMQKLLSFEL